MKEIEIKSLLTREKYDSLKEILPQKFKKINEDSITTVRFKPKDIRVRFSDKINELVFKDGDPTTFSRNEISINLKDRDECQKMISLLRHIGFNDDPAWIQHKHEFICEHNGHEYTLSLQHIENFAYLLEAEIIADSEEQHISNLKQILTDLDCTIIDAEEFKAKINEYIKNFSKK